MIIREIRAHEIRELQAEAARLAAEWDLTLTPETLRVLAGLEPWRCALCRPRHRRTRAAGRLDCAECCARVDAEEAALTFGAAKEARPLGPESDGSAAEQPSARAGSAGRQGA